MKAERGSAQTLDKFGLIAILLANLGNRQLKIVHEGFKDPLGAYFDPELCHLLPCDAR